MLCDTWESIKRSKIVKVALSKCTAPKSQIWLLQPKQVPSFYFFAIQFGDHGPQIHAAGLDPGQA